MTYGNVNHIKTIYLWNKKLNLSLDLALIKKTSYKDKILQQEKRKEKKPYKNKQKKKQTNKKLNKKQNMVQKGYMIKSE